MVDRSIKKSVGMLYDVLVKFNRFILTADIVMLDYKIDHEIPIILWISFLTIGRVLMDMEHGNNILSAYWWSLILSMQNQEATKKVIGGLGYW